MNNEVFYRLKYGNWPKFRDLEELYETSFGQYVLNEWASAIIMHLSNDDIEITYALGNLYSKRIQENFVWEFEELLHDMEHSSDFEKTRVMYMNSFYDLLDIAEEMKYGEY